MKSIFEFFTKDKIGEPPWGGFSRVRRGAEQFSKHPSTIKQKRCRNDKKMTSALWSFFESGVQDFCARIIQDEIGEPPWEYNFLVNLPESEYPKYLAKIFKYRTGEKLPLRFDFKKQAWIIDKKKCKTFNQKIQWIKLYGVTDLMRKCTDKVVVRNYVTEKIGEEYLKTVLQIIHDESQQSTQVIAGKSASIEDLRGNLLNKGNNVDCHGSQNAVEPRNDMRSVESIRLSVIANVTTSNTGNVWQSRKNAELDEIATEPKTPSFHSNDGRLNVLQPKSKDVSTYFDQINWEKLPQAFVIKCNHGCKWQYIIKNKEQFLNTPQLFEIVKRNITGWLEQEYWCWGGFEMQYKSINSKIIIEMLLRNNQITNEDLEIYCFNGIPKIIRRIHNNGTYNVSIYDEKFKNIDLKFLKEDVITNKPIDAIVKQSVEISKILAKDFYFVRVDWLIFENKLYFNELTFTPFSGFIHSKNAKWNKQIGIYMN